MKWLPCKTTEILAFSFQLARQITLYIAPFLGRYFTKKVSQTINTHMENFHWLKFEVQRVRKRASEGASEATPAKQSNPGFVIKVSRDEYENVLVQLHAENMLTYTYVGTQKLRQLSRNHMRHTTK